ncbi:hypothetical protein [Muriicola sp. Z0-33]|uniref:hypothetical protein n=1 Tax=Muriicola sp. Z0-33 TaxID=2816957 RepID=UPI00223906CD|nr:hypothetical protein [Muriicola sp. Z0-33]MCW5517183.1 hypothetical protein [Muriicola sp. Z0-33]
MIKPNHHVKIALIYFILAAVLGLVLRSFNLLEIPINYKFILNTHSHIALLGWVYLSVSTILYKLYLAKTSFNKKYSRIFWFTQVSLIGMLFTFPFMGYALFSIIFSTLFLFASYWFTWFFLKYTPITYRKSDSFKCIRASLWYLVISSAGPWALGAIMNILGPESVWYRLAIYFYLHFLYNGWMILSLVGMLLFVLERQQLVIPEKTMKLFYGSLNLGIILSFFLSALFAKPHVIVNILGAIGAILQIGAFLVLGVSLLKIQKRADKFFSPLHIGMLKIIVFLAGLKMILQLLSALPYFAGLAVEFLDFTIGYLHLTFLGVVTIGLFLFLDYFKMLRIRRNMYYLYLSGFILSELFIFSRAITAWLKLKIIAGNSELIAIASLLMVLSLMLILLSNSLNIRRGNHKH